MARQLQTHFGVVTPPLNAAPLLGRTVMAFGGGPPLYAAAKRVGRALNLPLTLHGDLVQIDPLEKNQSPERRKAYLMDGMPEMAFAVTIIIVLKLVYGLDDQPRYVRSRDLVRKQLPITND
jgi:RNA polymerase I-specific transcription initiation factor RRN7